MPQLLPLRHYVSVQEAHQLRSLLEEEGIPVFIDGEATSSMMPHLGMAIDVRLLVPAEQLTRAEQLVATAQRRAEENLDAAPWFCGACQESIEGSFEICWSCGRARGDVEAEPDTPPPSPPKVEDFHSAAAEPKWTADPSNPYAATGLAADFDDATAPWTDEEDLVLRRARKAAVVGTAFLPIVMSMYSLSVLYTLPRVRRLHPAARRQTRWIIALNAAAIVGWSLFFGALVVLR